MSQNYEDQSSLLEALQWHLDHGADEMMLDSPVDRTVMPEMSPSIAKKPLQIGALKETKAVGFSDTALQDNIANNASGDMMGAAQAIIKAQELAAKCKTLGELVTAIKEFEGISIRKTAANMVFSDGNPKAAIMVIGEAPAAEDDIQGKAFAGQSGELQDKILACIGLDRKSEDPDTSVYMSNILNWRPPGNRTPTQAELDISLPFIERHIALIQPKAIIFCGGGVGKALLRKTESISKLRGGMHNYQTPEILRVGEGAAVDIPAIVTYPPEYLLKTPAQKKAVWADMLMFQEKLKDILK